MIAVVAWSYRLCAAERSWRDEMRRVEDIWRGSSSSDTAALVPAVLESCFRICPAPDPVVLYRTGHSATPPNSVARGRSAVFSFLSPFFPLSRPDPLLLSPFPVSRSCVPPGRLSFLPFLSSLLPRAAGASRRSPPERITAETAGSRKALPPGRWAPGGHYRRDGGLQGSARSATVGPQQWRAGP